MTAQLTGRDRLILVTGPTRSGKSEWAEQLAHESGQPVTYIATAQGDPTDAEWQARIKQHRLRRPATWTTVQAPVDLVGTIQAAPTSSCLLIDSLGTWLANVLDQDDTTWNSTAQTLLHTLNTVTNRIIVVAEEVGWGVVPAYALGRQFRDRLGLLTRQIAALANPVYLVTAGFALNLRAVGIPVSQPLPHLTQPSEEA